jgi:histidinol-phosphate phosphatase family protein
MSTTVLRPAVLLDRDGTLIRERHYLGDPDRVELLPGVGVGLRRLAAAGLPLVVVSNQSGLGRGLLTPAQVDLVDERMVRLLEQQGAALAAIYRCPHAPDQGCACRKPAPGLALEAAAALGLDLGASFVVGDKASDLGLARAVGATGVLVRSGYGLRTEADPGAAGALVADGISAAADMILARVARVLLGAGSPEG